MRHVNLPCTVNKDISDLRIHFLIFDPLAAAPQRLPPYPDAQATEAVPVGFTSAGRDRLGSDEVSDGLWGRVTGQGIRWCCFDCRGIRCQRMPRKVAPPRLTYAFILVGAKRIDRDKRKYTNHTGHANALWLCYRRELAA